MGKRETSPPGHNGHFLFRQVLSTSLPAGKRILISVLRPALSSSVATLGSGVHRRYGPSSSEHCLPRSMVTTSKMTLNPARANETQSAMLKDLWKNRKGLFQLKPEL